MSFTDSTRFDFNSTQPLPWRTQQTEREKPLQFREFAPLRDPDLLAYLDSRNISVGFLIEIDQYLRGHPEITSCPQGLTMLQTMNALSPLEAYRIFIKGYTRPARYRDGIVTTNFSLPVGFRPPPLKARLDPELEEFFDGFEYRWDILENIDRTVAKACVAMATGRFVNSSLRRLICYAVWGNPVDAYSTCACHTTSSYFRTQVTDSFHHRMVRIQHSRGLHNASLLT